MGAVVTYGALGGGLRECRIYPVTNGRTAVVVVVIDDRGPFVRGRVIDLSAMAARRLGMIQNGVVQVRLEVVS
jgi:rare lipoprotein A